MTIQLLIYKKIPDLLNEFQLQIQTLLISMI